MSTLKVTDDYLDGFAKTQIKQLIQQINGTYPGDGTGTMIIDHVNDFAGGAGSGLPSGTDNYTLLMTGGKSFTEAATLTKSFTTFAGSIQKQFQAVNGALDKIVLGMLNAKQTFNNAEDEALSAAQMFSILSGGTPPPAPPTTTP
ncbi:hypothetical protein ACFYNO_24015 [Kitasatospora sp. NPDC006697]|uniref:hypothetical protein n=1 Tax=Kitasatospora sp. NPDC006697 TaxID=3364020 RepID=UPI003696865E